MSDSIFDDRPTRSRGCPVCGENNTMAVTIQARKLNEKGEAVGRQVSRQASYCQEHGEALYRKLIGEIGKPA